LRYEECLQNWGNAKYLPKFRTETLTAQEMIEAIKIRIQEVNEVIKTQMALREKLEQHIEWFGIKMRRKR
jgi:hypothetical protein